MRYIISGKNLDITEGLRSAVTDKLGKNRLNVTIGSALDLFGGPMNYEETVKFIAK